MIRFAFDAITGFSIMPLRIASYLGVAMGMLELRHDRLHDPELGAAVPRSRAGPASPTIVLVIGSTQLLVLGVFGEYLGRMYIETKRRPLFVIESVAGREDPAAQRSRPRAAS